LKSTPSKSRGAGTGIEWSIPVGFANGGVFEGLGSHVMKILSMPSFDGQGLKPNTRARCRETVCRRK
jgi:hypothetical protein